MSAHTPGPWSIQIGEKTILIGPLIDTFSKFALINPVIVRMEADRPAVYSHVGKHNGSRQRLNREEYETLIANAALIAGAPDLLAALKAAEKIVTWALSGVALSTAAYAGMLVDRDKIRAVIAKYEGRP